MMELRGSAMLATHRKGKSQANKKGKGKVPPQANIKKDSKCFFYKKKGHMKKECEKFQKWLADKGNAISFVINLIWSMPILTLGGLIMDQQFTFRIPCRVCKT